MKRSPPSGPRMALDDNQPPTPPTVRKSHCDDLSLESEPKLSDSRSMEDGSNIHGWVRRVLHFLEVEGQNLLSAICARYKIPYNGSVSTIPEGMLEQIAYNAFFNPALPKGEDGLPLMLRDVPGVTGFRLTFLKDRNGVFKSNVVTAKLRGSPFTLECRACSYCGSCFSGRFMELDSTHQRAGGWKEITDKIHAGKYSWKDLKGWRLCVPCFTNYGQKGTMDNANRLGIKEVIRCSPCDLKEGWYDNHPRTVTHGCALRDAMASSPRRGATDVPETPRPSKRQRKERSVELCEPVEVLADGDWWHAHILEVAPDGSALVHYVGGTADEDEWISKGSGRIRTSHITTREAPTPTPQSTPLVAPMKDRDVSLPPCGALLEEAATLQPETKLSPCCSSVEPVCASAEGEDEEVEAEDEEEEDEREEEVSTVVEVEEKGMMRGGESVVEVSIMATGGDGLRYQWFEGREAIPGAKSSVLKLVNSGEAGGQISCRLSNACGTTWAFCPVILPSTPEAAIETCSGFYRLTCRCGTETEGVAEYLCETPCRDCGAICCGSIEKLQKTTED